MTTTDQARTEQADGDSPPERVPLLADAPLRDPALDGLGYVAFANAMCLVIDHERTATPLTIALSAPWGGGKSSISGMLQTPCSRAEAAIIRASCGVPVATIMHARRAPRRMKIACGDKPLGRRCDRGGGEVRGGPC